MSIEFDGRRERSLWVVNLLYNFEKLFDNDSIELRCYARVYDHFYLHRKIFINFAKIEEFNGDERWKRQMIKLLSFD
jgi:hypothetical protein